LAAVHRKAHHCRSLLAMVPSTAPSKHITTENVTAAAMNFVLAKR
jgi:hypothetical protein